MNVGAAINKLRKERKMTLVELSEKSGVALATLSRMENGKMTGTMDSHMSICNALGIKLPDLYKSLYSAKNVVDVHTKKSPIEVFAHNKRFSEEILASKVSGKKMMPILIKIKRGGKTQAEESKPGIEKFIYVIDGKIEANVGEEKYNLMKGDTLYFEASTPHYFKNSDTSESHLLCTVSPPLL